MGEDSDVVTLRLAVLQDVDLVDDRVEIVVVNGLQQRPVDCVLSVAIFILVVVLVVVLVLWLLLDVGFGSLGGGDHAVSDRVDQPGKGRGRRQWQGGAGVGVAVAVDHPEVGGALEATLEAAAVRLGIVVVVDVVEELLLRTGGDSEWPTTTIKR